MPLRRRLDSRHRPRGRNRCHRTRSFPRRPAAALPRQAGESERRATSGPARDGPLRRLRARPRMRRPNARDARRDRSDSAGRPPRSGPRPRSGRLLSPAMPGAGRHDRDAGGPAEVLAAKARLREEVWSAMSVKGIARFPSPAGRIPNFVGAEAAAAALADTDEWKRARTIKANPDAPQLPVRVRALRDGKLLYMAVPRLAGDDPFFVLDPEALADPPHKAATIKGAGRSARTVSFDEMHPVDLVVAGSVAVGEDGARLGKGGGFSDLEFALALAAGLIGPRTIVATTVHDVQVQDAGVI